MVEHTLLRRFVPKLLLRGMAAITPPELLDNRMCFFGEPSALRRPLGLINRLTCYLTLVDKSGLIRWTASGAATPQELERLFAMVVELARDEQIKHGLGLAPIGNSSEMHGDHDSSWKSASTPKSPDKE